MVYDFFRLRRGIIGFFNNHHRTHFIRIAVNIIWCDSHFKTVLTNLKAFFHIEAVIIYPHVQRLYLFLAFRIPYLQYSFKTTILFLPRSLFIPQTQSGPDFKFFIGVYLIRYIRLCINLNIHIGVDNHVNLYLTVRFSHGGKHPGSAFNIREINNRTILGIHTTGPYLYILAFRIGNPYVAFYLTGFSINNDINLIHSKWRKVKSLL